MINENFWTVVKYTKCWAKNERKDRKRRFYRFNPFEGVPFRVSSKIVRCLWEVKTFFSIMCAWPAWVKHSLKCFETKEGIIAFYISLPVGREKLAAAMVEPILMEMSKE
jgi:hypothetical protein